MVGLFAGRRLRQLIAQNIFKFTQISPSTALLCRKPFLFIAVFFATHWFNLRQSIFLKSICSCLMGHTQQSRILSPSVLGKRTRWQPVTCYCDFVMNTLISNAIMNEVLHLGSLGCCLLCLYIIFNRCTWTTLAQHQKNQFNWSLLPPGRS